MRYMCLQKVFLTFTRKRLSLLLLLASRLFMSLFCYRSGYFLRFQEPEAVINFLPKF
jgi:hypothetical protein